MQSANQEKKSTGLRRWGRGGLLDFTEEEISHTSPIQEKKNKQNEGQNSQKILFLWLEKDARKKVPVPCRESAVNQKEKSSYVRYHQKIFLS